MSRTSIAALAARARPAPGWRDPEDKPWGDRAAVVTDPDGYRWVLATFKKLVPFGRVTGEGGSVRARPVSGLRSPDLEKPSIRGFVHRHDLVGAERVA